MTFLNPLLLFGLFAAAIPIIIHLLNLRKLKTIEFSSLRFLKELQTTTMRRVQIRQWLLLALRTLIIAAIVLAFARPALRGSFAMLPFGGSPHAKSTIILLLDDSPSMEVRSERGVFFSEAKQTALRILDLMKDGDEAYILRLSDILRTNTPASSHVPAQVKNAVHQMQLSQATVRFRDAFGVAAKILGESKNFNQEVYLLTDVQASQLTNQREDRDTTDLFGDNVKLFIVDVGNASSTTPENLGITASAIASRIVSQGKPVSLQASIQNAGPSTVRNSVLSLYLDGTRVVQQSLDIASQNSVTSTLQFLPRRRGIRSGYLQLEDDALEIDNRRYFTLDVPLSLRVLAVGATLANLQLPTLALTLDRDSSSGGVFSVERATEGQFASFELDKFDIILLVGVEDFSPAESDRIARFVSGGGGALIFPGTETDIDNYNFTLLKALGVPPAQPQEPRANPIPSAQRSSFLSFKKIDFDHPLFAGLFEQSSTKKPAPGIESPKVFTAVRPHAGAHGRTIVSLSDGTDFLTEYRHGQGKILLCAVEAGTTWSDFPLKGIFVPLLYRSGLYLGQQSQPPQLTVGDEIRFSARLRQRTDKDAFVLRSPSGIEERVVPHLSATTGMTTFSSFSSFETGVYELRHLSGNKESDPLYAVAVNGAKEETDLRQATDKELQQFVAQVGLGPEQFRRLRASENVDAAILESRLGMELWKYSVGLALLLALVEMAVGRERKERKV